MTDANADRPSEAGADNPAVAADNPAAAATPFDFEPGLPLESFAERVLALARIQEPEATFSFVQGDALSLHGEWPDGYVHEAHLDNIWRVYQMTAEGESCREDLLRYVSLLRRHDAEAAPGIERVVALVRNKALLEEIAGHRGDAAEAPETKLLAFPMIADMIVVLAYDFPDRVQLLVESDLETLGLEPADLYERGVTNVLSPLRVERHGQGSLFLLTAGGNYEASLLLNMGIWEQLQEDVAGDLLVAAPCRDVVYYTGSEDADGLAALAGHVRRLMNVGAHRVSGAILRFTGEGWEAFGMAEDLAGEA